MGGLNVPTKPLQNVDCKHQIDIVDMVGPKPTLELLSASGDTDLEGRKAREKAAIWTGEIIHRRNSNIAHTSEKREGRVKSGEVLVFIYILYRDFRAKSMF